MILKPTDEGALNVDQIIARIQKAVASYVSVQTTTGLMIAGASWAVMALVGPPQPIFWDFLICAASYVPIIGGVVAIFMPALFSVMVFEGCGKPLILLSTLLTVAAMAILAQFKTTRWLAVLLSNDSNPYPTKPRRIVRRTRVLVWPEPGN